MTGSCGAGGCRGLRSRGRPAEHRARSRPTPTHRPTARGKPGGTTESNPGGDVTEGRGWRRHKAERWGRGAVPGPNPTAPGVRPPAVHTAPQKPITPPAPCRALSSPDRATVLPSVHRERGPPPARFCTGCAPSHRPRTGGSVIAPGPAAPHRPPVSRRADTPASTHDFSEQHRPRHPGPAPPPRPVPVPVRSAPSMSLSSAVSMSLAARSSRASPSRVASSKLRALIAAALTGSGTFRTGGAA